MFIYRILENQTEHDADDIRTPDNKAKQQQPQDTITGTVGTTFAETATVTATAAYVQSLRDRRSRREHATFVMPDRLAPTSVLPPIEERPDGASSVASVVLPAIEVKDANRTDCQQLDIIEQNEKQPEKLPPLS